MLPILVMVDYRAIGVGVFCAIANMGWTAFGQGQAEGPLAHRDKGARRERAAGREDARACRKKARDDVHITAISIASATDKIGA